MNRETKEYDVKRVTENERPLAKQNGSNIFRHSFYLVIVFTLSLVHKLRCSLISSKFWYPQNLTIHWNEPDNHEV